jgi:hypothetical protein
MSSTPPATTTTTVPKVANADGSSWKSKLSVYGLYGSLIVTVVLLITNIIMLSKAAGSADSWNEIKKQMSAITGTAVGCGLALTIALFLIVSQYPQMQVTIMSIALGVAITLAYVAVCIAVISR